MFLRLNTSTSLSFHKWVSAKKKCLLHSQRVPKSAIPSVSMMSIYIKRAQYISYYSSHADAKVHNICKSILNLVLVRQENIMYVHSMLEKSPLVIIETLQTDMFNVHLSDQTIVRSWDFHSFVNFTIDTYVGTGIST